MYNNISSNWLDYCNIILAANYRNTAEKTHHDHPIKNAIKVCANTTMQGETVHIDCHNAHVPVVAWRQGSIILISFAIFKHPMQISHKINTPYNHK